MTTSAVHIPSLPADNHMMSSRYGAAPQSQHDRLTAAAHKWVATSFFEPLLREVRNSPWHKNDRFSGGKAADTFGALQDEFFAGQMSRGTGNKLVKAIVDRIEGAKAYAKHKNPPVSSEREGADRTGDKPLASRSAHVETII
jgi:hypothetical protein